VAYAKDLTANTDSDLLLVSGNGISNPNAGITNQVLEYDVGQGKSYLVSHANADPDTAAKGDSGDPVISGDGTLVAFDSSATALLRPVAACNGGGGGAQVFRFDRGQAAGAQNVLVSGVSATTGGNGASFTDAVSDTGVVLFDSRADNLATGDTNGSLDVFVGD